MREQPGRLCDKGGQNQRARMTLLLPPVLPAPVNGRHIFADIFLERLIEGRPGIEPHLFYDLLHGAFAVQQYLFGGIDTVAYQQLAETASVITVYAIRYVCAVCPQFGSEVL